MSTAHVVWNGFFQHERTIMKHSVSQQTLPRGTKLFIYSQQCLLCLLVLGGFCCFLTPPPLHRNHQGHEKAKPLADHWSMTQLWKSPPSNQIVRLQGAEVPQSCPRPLNVTGQLWGVNAHFSQLSRTCDGGKGKRKSTEVITLTNNKTLWNT